jgi:3-phenylpropionate/cinnamic acid dioxygenase small subunit
MSETPRNPACPSTLEGLLLDEVVIFENQESTPTGAQSIAPDHIPREINQARPVPRRSVLSQGVPHALLRQQHASLQQQVEQFLFHQAELLDGKHWSAVIDLFDEDGIYWMPVTPEQTDWVNAPSIFAEDKPMMRIRMGRVTHPNAWSQAPTWGTSHLVGNVVIESVSEDEVLVRSRFQMIELRRDNVRHFAGAYRHTLKVRGEEFKIALQRVDMLNAQAPFDYVLQIWV